MKIAAVNGNNHISYKGIATVIWALTKESLESKYLVQGTAYSFMKEKN